MIDEAAQSEHPFDLALMDWMMPGMDGIEVVRQIQSHSEKAYQLPIIMVTAYGREEVIDNAVDIKTNGVLAKPVTPSTLLDSIMPAFGHEMSEKVRSEVRQEDELEAEKQLCGARILLVEDNEINQELALELLSSIGMLTSVANNGQEALEILATQEFDGVLMDVQMPVMDGYTATRELRKQERFRDLPVIAMTANVMAGDREDAKNAGMNDHIAKPINVHEMLTTMAKWIKPETTQNVVVEPASASLQHLPDKLPGFDLESGLQRMNGSHELYLRLLGNFAGKYADIGEKIKMEIDAKEWVSAQGLIHNLKGLAANLSATDLHHTTRSLETAVKQETPDAEVIASGFAFLQTALAQAIASAKSLQVISKSVDDKETVPVSPSLIREVGEKLRQIVIDSDITELDAITSALPAECDYTHKIKEFADEYDMDSLMEIAVEMVNYTEKR